MQQFKANQKETLNELDISIYTAFTYDKLFGSASRRNAEKLSGLSRYQLHTVLNRSIDEINQNDSTNYTYRLKDFRIGFYHVIPSLGFEYRLFFEKNTICCQAVHLNDKSVRVEIKADFEKQVINCIMPLWGDRVASLSKFLGMFVANARHDHTRILTLTIVYVFKENPNSTEIAWKNSVEKFLNSFKQHTSYQAIKLIVLQSKIYSRARALQIGVDNCCANQTMSLLFFCDVDIVFNVQFLDMCRSNTQLNRTVFYPVLYSLYNPAFNHQTAIDKTDVNFTISRDSGFWRDFGFGMACQYKKDFLSINGFKDIGFYSGGWGDEDLYLYRKYANSNLDIIRAIMPGIFHVYHGKSCDKNELTKQQYTHCLDSKIFQEASHRAFGLKFFNFSESN